MEKKITIWIDSVPVESYEGQTVLEAALAVGMYIPHLCSHPDLPIQGGCGLCVIRADDRKNLVRACETYVRQGMKVTTDDEEIHHYRNVMMELMLASHPHDCSTCKRYLKCELQSVMQYLGIIHSRMRTIHRRSNTINSGGKHPLIIREMERCIQCGRCVRACNDLRKVEVLQYKKIEGETYIGTADDLPLEESGCRFCGACVAVCPTGALQDAQDVFRGDLPERQALVPCQAECPAHIDIPAYVRSIGDGDYSGAVGIIREKVPFPHTLGYVCNNRCENRCKRGRLNSSISIRELKRFAVEHDREKSWSRQGFRKQPTGKNVAVVGAGPCGLTAAYYLNKLGHHVDIYEKQKIAGGYLTGGIPEYRLPLDDVMEEIKYIIDSGIHIYYEKEIQSVKELRNRYDAVLVAIGTSVGRKLSLAGSEHGKVYAAVDLLRKSREEVNFYPGMEGCIIGGGNVAFDTARALVRLGIKANVVCLEKDASQADPEECAEAAEEGVQIYDCCSSERIEGDDGQITGLRVHRICGFRFGENGELIEEIIPESSFVIPCDFIVFASGQTTGLTEEFGLKINSHGYPVNPATGKSDYITSVDGIFAAGDVITGTRFVIDAIAGAREVVSRVDVYLGGDGSIEETLTDRERNPGIGRAEDFALKERVQIRKRRPDKRKSDFKPVSDGMLEEEAVNECGRCMQCDLRRDISREKLWTEYV